MQSVRYVLLYIEKNFVRRLGKVPVYDMGQACFQQIVLNCEIIKVKVIGFRAFCGPSASRFDASVASLVCSLLDFFDLCSWRAVASGRSVPLPLNTVSRSAGSTSSVQSDALTMEPVNPLLVTTSRPKRPRCES